MTTALSDSGVMFADGTLIRSAVNLGLRNRIINGNFGINQRVVAGTVTLTAGAYGHDRFKGGAGGCTYTFATALNVTTITISAGTLQQVVEGLNLQSGTHVLSWTGTAQGKIGAGSFSATGVTGTAVGGTNLTVEFNTGTVSKVQLEEGSLATVFEQRLFPVELAMCQRYYEKSYTQAAKPGSVTTVITQVIFAALPASIITTYTYGYCRFSATKRAAATVTTYDADGNTGRSNNDSGVTYGSSTCLAIGATEIGFGVANNSGGTLSPSFGTAFTHWAASAEL